MIRIGDVAEPDDLKATDIPAGNPAATAAGDRQAAGGRGEEADGGRASSPPPTVPTSRCRPRPGRRSPATRCCGRAATSSPRDGARRSRQHGKPQIYVLGARGRDLRGRRRPTGQARQASSASRGPDPVTNAIAFARFTDGGFGWGVTDPGHGFVFGTHRPAARRGRRGAALGVWEIRPAAARRGGPGPPPGRCRTTRATSSPATTRTRRAGSTITAG